jgi:hypothetical protein
MQKAVVRPPFRLSDKLSANLRSVAWGYET